MTKPLINPKNKANTNNTLEQSLKSLKSAAHGISFSIDSFKLKQDQNKLKQMRKTLKKLTANLDQFIDDIF